MDERLPLSKTKRITIDEVMKKEILTKEELCIYLNVPMSTIIVLIKDDSFPRCYFGRYVRFSRKAVEQWVMDGGRKGKK
ncbi:MAG: helix-turn-helix domain-containing protein [Planctomycetes bacterium]|nr:helix-turn-helix domain-containing protein [Planctomycetota bacterium]